MPIRVDVSQALALSGFLQQTAVEIGTPQHIGPVLKFVHAEMSREFNHYMDILAPTEPEKYHHVYEWNEIGQPNSRLWNNILVGGGATRFATWEWRASKTVVPVMPEARDVGVKQIHVFTWKAPVMEYETNLVIEPKRGSMLVFFTGPPGPRTGDSLTVYKNGQTRTVEYPGGEAVKGAFTDAFVGWWAGEGAVEMFTSKVRRVLEQDLAHMPLQSTEGAFKSGTRSRTKTLGIVTAANDEAAEMYGREAARRWLQQRDRNYIAGAEARGEFLDQ